MPKKLRSLSRSPKETAMIAEEILNILKLEEGKRKEATVVALSGELGAGKTALVKAVAKSLGIKDRLSSPTFVIMKKYPLRGFGRYGHFFHLDAYRLESKKELEVLGWKEVIKDPGNLVFIEWPEKVKGAIPKGAIKIKVSHRGEKERHFEMV